MSDTIQTVDELIHRRPGFADMEPANQQTAIKLNDFIYMSKGTSNAYMVVTEAGRVIINTGMGFEALTHKKIFDAVCPGPTPYILITQGHVDHVGGVGQFREKETQLVTQINNDDCQHDDERISTVRSSQAYIWFKKTIDYAMNIAADHPEVFIQDKPCADITYQDNYCFTLGGIDFEVISCPGGETVDSAVVWLPQHKILFSGNVVGPLFPHFPNINTIRGDKYRFIEPYLESVQRARALQAETLITGHFEPIVGRDLIDQSFARLHDAVDYVHRETLRGMNEKKSIYTLMKEVQLPPELTVGEGYGKISWAVRTIWESYMGWFKAQSTTELYPTQACDIYHELAELAGVDAIIERARNQLAAGNPEAALHLAEVAMAGQKNDSTIQLSLDAHRALRDRAANSNFWEDGWLQSQIAQLEESLDQQ